MITIEIFTETGLASVMQVPASAKRFALDMYGQILDALERRDEPCFLVLRDRDGTVVTTDVI